MYEYDRVSSYQDRAEKHLVSILIVGFYNRALACSICSNNQDVLIVSSCNRTSLLDLTYGHTSRSSQKLVCTWDLYPRHKKSFVIFCCSKCFSRFQFSKFKNSFFVGNGLHCLTYRFIWNPLNLMFRQLVHAICMSRTVYCIFNF